MQQAHEQKENMIGKIYLIFLIESLGHFSHFSHWSRSLPNHVLFFICENLCNLWSIFFSLISLPQWWMMQQSRPNVPFFRFSLDVTQKCRELALALTFLTRFMLQKHSASKTLATPEFLTKWKRGQAPDTPKPSALSTKPYGPLLVRPMLCSAYLLQSSPTPCIGFKLIH